MNAVYFLRSARARYAQCGLRAFFLWTTAICIALGVYVRRAVQQATAVRAIMASGGAVYYDMHNAERTVSLGKWRESLANSLGKDFAYRVTLVDLDSNADDALLCYVARLRDLEGIYFFHGAPRVTDAGMLRLTRLTRLTTFEAPGSRVTDLSLRALAALPGLVDITLDGARISDAGVACLQRRHNLRSLYVRNARGVTDDGMRSIGSLDELRALDLRGTGITSNGLKNLRNLKRLELLNLADNPMIGDAGLKYLRNLKRLESLDLSNNSAISDRGLASLSEMSALSELNLRNTSVTSKGLKRLARLRGLQVLDLSDNPGVADDGIKWLSQLRGIETLKLRKTAVTSEAVKHLRPLATLARLDISENRAVQEDALPHLGNLGALEWLDLHNTEVMRRGAVATESLNALQRLKKLVFLDVSGTGVDVTRVKGELPTTQVIGSRASFNVTPGMVSYVCLECEATGIAHAVEYGMEPRYLSATSHRPFREGTAHAALDRMLSLSAVEGIAQDFADQRPVVQLFRRRAEALGYRAERQRATLFADLVAAMRRDNWLKRLYAAGSDLQFADAVQAHVEFLERVKRDWTLTNVELSEYVDGERYVRVLLRDAALNLGVQTNRMSEKPSDEIVAIWRRTRVMPKEPPKLSCWEMSPR